jgi:hypothetical protein
VNLSPTNSFEVTVHLICDGLPVGAICDFSGQDLTIGPQSQNADVAVRAVAVAGGAKRLRRIRYSTIAPGTYTVTLRMSSAGVVTTAPFSFTVQ